MPQLHTLPVAGPVVLMVFACLTTSLHAANRVTVHLKGGRVLTGELDSRTDDDALWLRFQYSSIVLSSSYAWSCVESVDTGVDQLNAERFRALVPELLVPAADLPVPVARDEHPPLIYLPRREHPARTVTQVSSLLAAAKPANWDRDAALDGLEICVIPRNLEREPVPTPGHLTVTLMTRHRKRARDATPVRAAQRWSLRVAAADFRDGCAVYRLPFRLTQGNLTAAQVKGTLRVRLHAYGQGTFEAEAPIQPPYRDF